MHTGPPNNLSSSLKVLPPFEVLRRSSAWIGHKAKIISAVDIDLNYRTERTSKDGHCFYETIVKANNDYHDTEKIALR